MVEVERMAVARARRTVSSIRFCTATCDLAFTRYSFVHSGIV